MIYNMIYLLQKMMTGINTLYSAVKLSFAGWFRLRLHFIVADWMTAF